MSPTSGLLSSEQLGVLIDQGDIETVLVGFTDLYGRVMGKSFEPDL